MGIFVKFFISQKGLKLDNLEKRLKPIHRKKKSLAIQSVVSWIWT